MKNRLYSWCNRRKTMRTAHDIDKKLGITPTEARKLVAKLEPMIAKMNAVRYSDPTMWEELYRQAKSYTEAMLSCEVYATDNTIEIYSHKTCAYTQIYPPQKAVEKPLGGYPESISRFAMEAQTSEAKAYEIAVATTNANSGNDRAYAKSLIVKYGLADSTCDINLSFRYFSHSKTGHKIVIPAICTPGDNVPNMNPKLMQYLRLSPSDSRTIKLCNIIHEATEELKSKRVGAKLYREAREELGKISASLYLSWRLGPLRTPIVDGVENKAINVFE